MMARILLPLLLIVSAVAADEIGDLCQQLVQQINYIQGLVPIEVAVNFPHSRFVSGHAKFRIVPGLTLEDGGCSSVLSNDQTSKMVTIRVKSSKAYISTSMKVLMVNDPTYTLTLNVEKPKLGSLKKVTVSGFKLESESIFGDSTAVSAAYKNFVIENLQASLQKELEQRLNTNFDVNNSVEINGKLVKGLLLNVFKATAQDF